MPDWRDAAVVLTGSLVLGAVTTPVAATGRPGHPAASARTGPESGLLDGGYADVDGDGRPDRVTVQPAYPDDTLRWRLQASSSVGEALVPFGRAGDATADGDFDGDGRTDLAVVRGDDAGGALIWIVLRSSDGLVRSVHWGRLGNSPVAGDFDGDGRTDPAVVRGDGVGGPLVWQVRPSGGGRPWSARWGRTGDLPVSGDYDGDGRSDLAVLVPRVPRPPGWLIRSSATGSTLHSPLPVLPGRRPARTVTLSADVDGDGLPDYLRYRVTPAGGPHWRVHWSADRPVHEVH